MKSRMVSFLIGLAVLAATPLVASAGEVYAILASTQRFQGNVPAGEDIRLEFPIPAGVEPRLTFALTGASATQPISFSELHLLGPDGQEIFLPAGSFFDTKCSGGNPTLTFRGWTSTLSGNHQILIRTHSRVLTHAKGRLVVKRTLSIPIAGDELTPIVKVPLQPGDVSSLTVKRVSGSAPKVILYKLPSGVQSMPGQKISKTGTKSNGLLAVQFGEHQYTIGYQAAPLAGQWKGTLKITPFKGGGPATLRLRNTPGVALSVRDADRSAVPSIGGSGVGVATDGNVVTVTSEQGGVLMAQAFDRELVQSLVLPNPVSLTSAVDFTPGEQLSGHRLLFTGGFYFAAYSTVSGKEIDIIRLRTDLVRDGYAQVVTNSADPTADFFLTGNLSRVAVGVFHPTNGQTVRMLNLTDFASRTTVSIGGASYPQMSGSGAAWRPGDSVFELWTPDTLDFHGPSDLHRVLFDANFVPTTADAKPVNDPALVETMPTAITVDGPTGITIVHYVAADNPPADITHPGTGKIHRRLFDPLGVEIPGSHVILPRSSCNRPASTILGNFLYVGYETPSGPVVERYPLLR